MKQPLYIYAQLSSKFPKMDFFELYEKRDRIAKKLPNITKVRDTDWTLAEHRKINHLVLKDKLNLLLDTLVAKKYKNVELIDEIRQIINNEDLRYYSQYQKFNFSYDDNFSDLYFFYYDNEYINKIKRYKAWTGDREYNIFDLLNSILRKHLSKKREKEYYSRIREFRKSKKQTFLVEVDFLGYYFWSDWTTSHRETLYLLITDTNKETVINRLTKGVDKDATCITKSLSSKKCHQGTIKQISFLDFNEENLLKVKDCKDKKDSYGKPKYERWECFSNLVNQIRFK